MTTDRIRKYVHNPDGSIRRKLTRKEIQEQRMEKQRTEHYTKLAEEATKRAEETDIPPRRPHEPRDMSPPAEPQTLTEDGDNNLFWGVAVQISDDHIILDDGKNTVRVKGLPDDMEFKLGFGYQARGEVIDANIIDATEIDTHDDPLDH